MFKCKFNSLGVERIDSYYPLKFRPNFIIELSDRLFVNTNLPGKITYGGYEYNIKHNIMLNKYNFKEIKRQYTLISNLKKIESPYDDICFLMTKRSGTILFCDNNISTYRLIEVDEGTFLCVIHGDNSLLLYNHYHGMYQTFKIDQNLLLNNVRPYNITSFRSYNKNTIVETSKNKLFLFDDRTKISNRLPIKSNYGMVGVSDCFDEYYLNLSFNNTKRFFYDIRAQAEISKKIYIDWPSYNFFNKKKYIYIYSDNRYFLTEIKKSNFICTRFEAISGYPVFIDKEYQKYEDERIRSIFYFCKYITFIGIKYYLITD